VTDRAAPNRVPHIILLYWVIKIASTTLGETGADMVSMTFDLGYGSTIGIFLVLFVALLVLKLSLEGYHPTAYWATFTASAIAGTAISDFIDRTLGLGYAWGSLILIALLLLTLVLWHRRCRTSIRVEFISDVPTEAFYWVAFLLANTLGTAAGDFLADDLGLGFVHSAVLISGVLVAVALLHYLTSVNGTFLFWIAFVLTRPFGATFGDFLTKPRNEGGVDLGTIGSSLFFAVVLVIAVRLETRRERSRRQAPALAATEGPLLADGGTPD
jgi:uncharacterized membrane-anchored protein